MKEESLHTCNNHGSVMVYRGEKCPWCMFKADMVIKLQSEYRRGFEDGVRASELEYAKKERENAYSAIESGATQSSGGRPGAGGGDSEGPEKARSVDERGE